MDSPTYEAAIEAAISLVRECLLSEDSDGNERANLLRELAENGTEPTSFSVKFTIDPGRNEIDAQISIPRGSHKSKHTTALPDPNQKQLDL